VLSDLLRHEARITLQLDHPNICRAHHYGIMDGRTVLVLQLLKGEDLNQRRRGREGGRLPLEEVVLAGIDAATGLRHAHQQGILHHDLKPSNLFYTHVGRVKVMDFGLPAAGPDRLLGTPGYMDPARISRGEHGPWSDVFSLGATLYTLAHGQLPFGTGEEALVRALQERPARSDALPVDFNDVVEACMDPRIEARPSLEEVQDVLLSAALARGLTLADAFDEEASGGTGLDLLWSDDATAEDSFARVPATTVSWADHEIPVEPFDMARKPVTRGEYLAFVKDTGWRMPDSWRRTGPTPDEQRLPVTGVTLDDARAYASWAQARLPTTAEWLAALRGDEGRRAPWGDGCRPGICLCPASGPDPQARSVDEGAATSTPQGITDLLGNVWEWTEPGPGPGLPHKAATWIAGGSFRSPCGQSRGAAPLTGMPAHGALDHLGFRLVR